MVYALTTVLVFAFAGSYWVYINYQTTKTHLQQRIASQGTLVGNNLGAAIIFKDDGAIHEILSTLGSDAAIVSAELSSTNLEKSILLSFPQNPQGAGLTSAASTQISSLLVPVFDSGQEIATINLKYDNAELNHAVKESALITLVIALVATILGSLLSRAFLRSVTAPILALSEVSKQVSLTKDYSLRSQTVSPDEVGALSDSFNAMLEIIEVRDRDLESRFEQAFFNAPIGMVLVDAKVKIISHNKIAESLFGIKRLTSDKVQDIIVHTDQDKVMALFIELITGQISKFDVEVNCIADSGDIVTIILNASTVLKKNKKFGYAVVQLQDVTESRRLSKELEFQAQHDSLTGLANRRVLNQAIAQVQADPRKNKKQHTLSILDLDQFKTVNDTFGHIAGDELLCQVADQIRSKVRKGDLVVRLGGDEFALLLYQCDKQEAQRITEDIRSAIESIHFNWEGHTLRISASIGAMASCLANTDTTSILQQVDSACFIAKEAGRNRVHIIETDDSDISTRHDEMQWVHRLHQAMSENLFVLFAQPIFSLGKGEHREYVEILLRLHDKDQDKLIAPGAFLPAAERYGLSVKVDQWVINHLIENLPKYRRAFGDKRSYWLNISGASLSDPQFLNYLEETITHAKLPPKMINFEITETSIIRNISTAKESMIRLKLLGCQFSLDDFGSGMSSFGYLKELPVDYIKIDGMFVRSMEDDPINTVFVKSIVDIASAMGIKTVAEYVESKDILSKLIEMGASYAQGYAMGLPEELLSEKLAKAIEEDETQSQPPPVSQPKLN